MLISHEYKEQQKAMHEKYDYGTASLVYAPLVSDFINALEITEVLDYGAGKMELIKTISDQKLVNHPFNYIPYEPANEKCCEPPNPAELVTCIDVLEHVEPECIDAVLDDLSRVVKKAGFFTVCSLPAKKQLPDGRNAHLIQKPSWWWLPKILERFELAQFTATKYGFWLIVRPREDRSVIQL